MPKETFFNLPKEKKERIQAAAILEFKNYHFDTASVNRIVENSAISKGSFYQYFEDKKDLYRHILSIIVDQKLQYMTPVMLNPFKYDFFTLIREMYQAGLNFAKEHPDLLEIGNKLLSDPNHQIYEEVLKENQEKSDEVFELLLNKALERGEIRKELDLKMIAYILTSLNISIADYYVKSTNKREYSEEMLRILDDFLDFIQYGIAYRGDKKDD